MNQTAPSTNQRLLRTLLGSWIDFAGPFPPASLPLETAVARYTDYRRGADAWFLGNLVVRLVDVPEVERSLRSRHDAPQPSPVPLSVVVGAQWSGVPEQLHALSASLTLSRVVAIEGRWAAEQASLWRQLTSSGYRLFVEVADEPPLPKQLATIAQVGAAAKLRMGGIEAHQIPSPDDAATFLSACRTHDLPYKLTAGLHHAWTGDYPLTYDAQSESARFFGFLPVCMAALLLEGDPEATAVAAEILTCLRPADVRLDPDEISWGNRRWTVEDCRQVRSARLLSVGSCSFEEPLADVRRLISVEPMKSRSTPSP